MAETSRMQHRDHIARTILVGNLVFFPLLILLFILKGFTPKELEEVLKFLAPIKAVYLTPIVRYIIMQQKKAKRPVAAKEGKLNPLYIFASKLIIYSYLLILFLLPVLSAFNLIGFELFRTIMAFAEFFYGGCIGFFIADLFGAGEKETA